MNASDYRGRPSATAMFNVEIDRRRLATARFTPETAAASQMPRCGKRACVTAPAIAEMG